MQLSVVVVNYNVSYFLEQTLKSVKRAIEGIEAEVFVVDNHSVDGSVEMVKKKFPEFILIANQQNVGFSKANNQAIRLSKGKYILLLNPDTVVQEDTFQKCISFMDNHSDGGGLGVYMVDGKGSFLPESKRGLPTPWVAFYKITGLSKFFPKSRKFGRYHLGFLDKNESHEIDVLSGAFMFMRKETLDKVGLLDEDYFMYGEDIDLSYRIIKAGYKNYYFSDTRIIHYKGESTKKSSVNYVIIFYSAMIIFAQKHFKGAYAGAFTLLIRAAIYARAGISIFNRFLNTLAVPLLNAIVIYAGMYLIKDYWENNFKHAPGYYPSSYSTVIIPLYILVWLMSVYYSGGFDKPYKAYRVVRGVFVGTIIISSISNFFDAYRYSKAIILLGGIWVITAVISIRFLIQLIKNRRIVFNEINNKKIVIAGDYLESKRVIDLINSAKIKADVVGVISTEEDEHLHDHYLGKIENISEIARIYKPEEIIFCSKNIAASDIIEIMAEINNSHIDYKIVPYESNFIIGSNSKDSNGELYTLDVHLNINDKVNIRNKRIVDISTSLFFIATFPVILFFVRDSVEYLKNLFSVLFNKYTMVGFASDNSLKLPVIKPGILSPITEFKGIALDNNTIHRLNLIYAKDYRTSTDLNIIFNCFRSLDRKVK